MAMRLEIPEDVLDALGGPTAPPAVIAVSGGPDSVALTLALDDARRDGRAPRLHLAHLNHRIRGVEAEGDAAFVAALAERLNLGVTVGECDVPAEAARRKLSLEHAARECRYEFLDRVSREVGARWVAVGHTADDQLETVLHNILRGAGIHGLAGMPRVRPLAAGSDARIVRPFLDVPRRELIAFLAARAQDYRTDATNRDTAYTRNRIRHALIPALEAAWPELREEAAAFARELGGLDALLELRAADWLAREATEEAAVPLGALGSLGEPVRSYVFRACIARVLGDLRRIDEVHVRMIDELAATGSTGASLDLPRGLVVSRDYGRLRFEKRERAPFSLHSPTQAKDNHVAARAPVLPPAEAALSVPGELRWGGWRLSAETLDAEALRAEFPGLPAEPGEAMREVIGRLRLTDPEGVQYLDADRVGEPPMMVRARVPGDRFTPLGAPGETKLKDYLIRRKVPRADRDRLALIVAAGRIVAVATVGVSDTAALTSDTRRVMRIRAAREETERDSSADYADDAD